LYGKDQKLVVDDDKGIYPILGTGGIMGYAKKYLYDKPSVLIGRKGTIDEPQYMETPFWTIDTLYYTDIYPENDAKFLYYVFQSIPWKNYNEATGVPSLAGSTIYKINVSLPVNKVEQHKIAEILTTVDKAIDNTRTLIEKYTNIKSGLMQDLLGDFAFKNHEKIPVLGNVQIINGGTPSTQNNNYWNGNIGWLSVEDFNTGHRYVYKAQKKITEAGLKNSSTTILKTGQIIISARGTVGVVAQMGNDMAFNQSCYGLNSVLYWTNDFLYYYLLFISDRIRSITHGNVFGTIIKDTFKDIFIPLIPKPMQDEIVVVLSSVDVKIESERDYLAKLQDIKKGLMQDLLTNTISVDPLL